MWHHGSEKPIEILDPSQSSGMNLWGGFGVYLTQDKNLAARFGPCISSYEIGALSILETDAPISDEHYSQVMGLLDKNVPFMTLAHAEVDTYGDAIILAADYGLKQKEHAVRALKELLGFDALFTKGVEGALNGETFEEGDLLILLDQTKARFIGSEYARVPQNVFFHGSKESTPIQAFKHGVHPAVTGFAGFSLQQVERHAFFFSSSPKMCSDFGYVHAYQLPEDPVLDLRNDIRETDKLKLESAGINTRWIDNKPTSSKWEIFDGQDGKEFVRAIKELGYKAVNYKEEDGNGTLHDCRALVDGREANYLPLTDMVISKRMDIVAATSQMMEKYSSNARSVSDSVLKVMIGDTLFDNGLDGDTNTIVKTIKRGDDNLLREQLSVWNPSFQSESQIKKTNTLQEEPAIKLRR
ncbi:hypothetical protein BM525_21200 (plasmid) [Alteromonas mediterranea]|uniref:Uncharacterized protein n=1 Tax=Alteromonas mediterranea TaxID=314275 RepID=A0AAC9JEN1_9ALTE|nr:hypothetical protein [Alteromonas mediterranea]APD92378.1 hypothetical protein BM524_20980 [Alteromonas mediterranea]APE00239.1 hypothetical protein BM525_21200 [Alteromonas mediterranea]